MDTVFIEGLEVDTLIGVYDWERQIRQCLCIDLCCAWDNSRPAQADDLSEALDYAQLCARIEAFAQDSHFQLLESFAEQLAQLLQKEFAIGWLRLRIGKPGAVASARMVGIEIERGSR